MKLSNIETETGVKISRVIEPKKEQKIDIEKELAEIKALLKEILQNIAKTSWHFYHIRI